MPYDTDFYGSLTTDKPIPEHVQQQIEFLSEIDLRSLVTPARPPFRRPDSIPDGFPVDAVGALVDKSVYRVHLYAESDTELSPAREEHTQLSHVSVQFVIDTFLAPHGIKATGRIEAAGEGGTDDLWAIVVGEDQIAHDYDGVVIYEDQPGYPRPAQPATTSAADIAAAAGTAEKRGAELAEAAIGLFIEYRDSHGYDEDAAQAKAITEVVEGEQARVELEAGLFDAGGHGSAKTEPDPVRALGSKLLTWASIDPADTESTDRFVKAVEFSSIPEAASNIGDSFAPSGFCDECGAETESTFESAPGPFHERSCSLNQDEDEGQ